MRKVLVVDNYDSFTFNLVMMIEKIVGKKVEVVKNDEIPFERMEEFTHIILSPGPGIPDEAGELKKLITNYSDKIKMLGVCLGHQAIAEVFGAKLLNLKEVYHGVETDISVVQNEKLFEGISSTFRAGRYHSWVVDHSSDTSKLDILSVDDKGEIMAIKHKDLCVYGVQFHPESIMTSTGHLIIQNFLNL